MPEATAVRNHFEKISPKYDLANDCLSFGIHRFWRKQLVASALKDQPHAILDLATGSGAVAFSLKSKARYPTKIVGLDFCEGMLALAKKEEALQNLGITFTLGDCLNLPFEDHSFDAITIAYGLRNLEDRQQGLREMHRVLKPHTGKLHILEFTQPKGWQKPFHRAYQKTFLPTLGKWITGDKDAYEYLSESIHNFPTIESIKSELSQAGFKPQLAKHLFSGISALHVAST